jgi:uncharacterized protein YggE
MRGKYLFVIALLAAVLLSGCGPSAQSAGAGGGAASAPYAQGSIIPPVYNSYTPGLTVVGTGTVEADPDVAYLSLGVDLKADNAAAVVADATGKMESLLAALKAAGVADADIRTAGYNLWVEQRYDPQTGQPTGVIDYHVVHTVRVTVHDLGKVGTLLSAAVEAGANTVSEVSFSVADPDKLATQARQKAIADAQQRAQEMAQAMGITLGKVVSVSESGGYVPAPDYYSRGAVAPTEAAVPMPAGSFSVSISVVVIYELP